MNTSCFKPLKDFDLYEINGVGDVRKITTKRNLKCTKTKSGDRFDLYDSGHHITISRSKIVYCYNHDTSPYELRGKVISDGDLLSISEHIFNLKEYNMQRMITIKQNKEKSDVIHAYERNLNILSLLYKLVSNRLSVKEARELSDVLEGSIRKALHRYYADKKEYRKEEIDDIIRDLYFGTFIEHCPFNMDLYVYEIVKRKLKNKKDEL